MDGPLKRLLGQGPYPFPLETFNDVFACGAATPLFTVSTRRPVTFMAGTHAHPGYAGESHGPSGRMVDSEFMTIQIEEEFVADLAREMFGKSAVADSIAVQIVVDILRQVPSDLPVSRTDPAPVVRHPIDSAITYLRESRETFSLGDVARVAGLSQFHLIRVFKAETGMTPYQYWVDCRLDLARRLLRGTDQRVAEIALGCGFKSISHFSTVFKRWMSVAPTEYRKAFRTWPV